MDSLATTSSSGYVCPFMDDLVDSLYTDELNTLIEKTCQTGLDKRTFMMFIMMYFFTMLNVSGAGTCTSEGVDRKSMLKEFMSDLIMNSEKRRRCVDLYVSFERSVAALGEPKLGEPKLGEPKLGEPKLGEPKPKPTCALHTRRVRHDDDSLPVT